MSISICHAGEPSLIPGNGAFRPFLFYSYSHLLVIHKLVAYHRPYDCSFRVLSLIFPFFTCIQMSLLFNQPIGQVLLHCTDWFTISPPGGLQSSLVSGAEFENACLFRSITEHTFICLGNKDGIFRFAEHFSSGQMGLKAVAELSIRIVPITFNLHIIEGNITGHSPSIMYLKKKNTAFWS